MWSEVITLSLFLKLSNKRTQHLHNGAIPVDAKEVALVHAVAGRLEGLVFQVVAVNSMVCNARTLTQHHSPKQLEVKARKAMHK